jgi:hypothetical protein
LTFENDKDGERKRKVDHPDEGNSSEAPPRARKKEPPRAEVGNALRSVYQRTIDESIPPEMLDLLGKLG